MKTTDLLWGISLILIGVCTLALSLFNIIGIELSGIVTVIIGAVDLICLPILAYTTVKKVKKL